MDLNFLSRVDSFTTFPSPSKVAVTTSTFACVPSPVDGSRRENGKEEIADGDVLKPMYRHGYLECLLRNFGKGLLLGWGGASVLALVPVLLKRKRQLSVTSVARVVVAPSNVAYGLFLGSFLSSYNTIIATTRQKGQRRSSWRTYRGALAGGAAGLSMVLLPPDAQVTFTLFALVRALEVGSKMSAEVGWLPSLPHGDVYCMMAAASRILYVWLWRPDALDGGYLRFLNKQGAKARVVVDAVAAHVSHAPLPLTALATHLAGLPTTASSTAALRCLAAQPQPQPPAHHLPCLLLHPGHRNCDAAAVGFIASAMRRTLPVYLPVYLLPLLLRLPSVARNPRVSLQRLGINILRSGVFLASFSALAWRGMCFYTQLCGRRRGSGGATAAGPWLGRWSSAAAATAMGVFGGAALLLEKRSRRIEIALYAAAQALRTYYTVRLLSRASAGAGAAAAAPSATTAAAVANKQAAAAGRHHSGADTRLMMVLFAVSCATLCHAFHSAPRLLRSSYYTVMRRTLDSDQRHNSRNPGGGGGGGGEKKRGDSSSSDNNGGGGRGDDDDEDGATS